MQASNLTTDYNSCCNMRMQIMNEEASHTYFMSDIPDVTSKDVDSDGNDSIIVQSKKDNLYCDGLQ